MGNTVDAGASSFPDIACYPDSVAQRNTNELWGFRSLVGHSSLKRNDDRQRWVDWGLRRSGTRLFRVAAATITGAPIELEDPECFRPTCVLSVPARLMVNRVGCLRMRVETVQGELSSVLAIKEEGK